MIVMGVDPGLAAVGWAIIEKKGSNPKLLAHGCLVTSKTKSFSSRLDHIYQEIKKLIAMYKPEFLAIEELFFAKNVKTAILVAQAVGVIKAAGEAMKTKVKEYTPLNVKTTITGFGQAEKDQVEYMVSQTLRLKKKIKPDHAADAAAVALTHTYTNSYLLPLK